MRRILLALACLLAAAAAQAAGPYFLDRNGVLWKATSSQDGLVLSAESNGAPIIRAQIPFEVAVAGTSDTEIQVAADELTGKVAVVWQRNWSAQVSEIMLAVWRDGDWERIEHLSSDLSAQPRYPKVRLSQVASTDPSTEQVIQDSFLNVVWWEGVADQHPSYAALRLTAEPNVENVIQVKDLDAYAGIGLACTTPAPPEVVEHPLFADQGARDHALMLVGIERTCMFQLVEVRFVLAKQPGAGIGGINVVAQRRRHMPIFGVQKSFQMTRDLIMEGARIMLGADLNPVVYRVVGNTLEYVTSTDTGWSPRRTLAVRDGLTLDQAIPLVENLAR